MPLGGRGPEGWASRPAGLSGFPELAAAGSAREGSAAASAPAAGHCPQPEYLASAASPQGSILQPGPGWTRPAGHGTRVLPRAGGWGGPSKALRDGELQLLSCRLEGKESAPSEGSPKSRFPCQGCGQVPGVGGPRASSTSGVLGEDSNSD